MNVVYVYVNGNYVSSTAGSDVNVTVENPSKPAGRVFNSPDGTRMVKVSGSGEDAFLYDTANPPAFQPIYLASGVKEVKISNTSNGRPLQIMLILNDGSFDLFDDQGNPFNGNGGSGGGNGGGNTSYNAPPVDNGANNPPPADEGAAQPSGPSGGSPPPNSGNPPAPNGAVNN